MPLHYPSTNFQTCQRPNKPEFWRENAWKILFCTVVSTHVHVKADADVDADADVEVDVEVERRQSQ